MTRYNPLKHHRRSIRLQNYDYSQVGNYFRTLCIQDKKHLFGEIKNGIMGLNIFGSLPYQEWLNTLTIRENISLGAFIIMPNHIHGIIHIDYQSKKNNPIGKFQSPSQTIGAIIRGYKGATTKRIKALLLSTGELQFAPTEKGIAPTEKGIAPTKKGIAPTEKGFATPTIDLTKSIWQRNYYENIIRDNKAYQNISHYIWNNPQSWTKDKFHQ